MMAAEATIGDCVKKWAEKDPDTPAFIFVNPKWQRVVLSRVNVYHLATKYAATLKSHGVKKGDIISNTLPNSPERLITHIGVILAGAVSMNGQVFLKDGEDFVRALKESGSAGVILDPRDPKGAYSFLEVREKVVREDGRVMYQELPALKNVFAVYQNEKYGSKSLVELLAKKTDELYVRASPDDVAVIWTTSGSTGFSKLVPLSHRKVLLFGERFSAFINLDVGDILFNAAPHGWSCGNLTTYLICGMTRVIPDFSVHAVDDMYAFLWELICREKCHGAFVRPYDMEQFLVSYSKKHQITDLDQIASTVSPGGSMPEDWKLKVMASGGQPLKKTHLAVLGILTESVNVAYGSTETGLMAWHSLTDANSYENCNNGRPPEGVQLKIVNKKKEELPCGKLGEVMCKCEQAFEGYLNNDSASLKNISPDGWINTGDIGSLNERGEVFVFCRKNLIATQGPFIQHPGWLESRMLTYPGVLDVVVVPVKDPVIHQELCACVVTHTGAKVAAEGFQEFCQGLFLKDTSDPMVAVPRYFLFFDALPVNSNGKICRKTTESIVAERLGLKTSETVKTD